MSAYQIGPITTSTIDAAYLLRELVLPPLGLREWRHDCQRVLRGETGVAIVTATSPLGHVKGLCIISEIVSGVMEVPVFVVASAADELGVSEQLQQYLKLMARSAGCDRVRIHPSGGGEILVVPGTA